MYPTQHHKKGKKINKISFSQTVLKKKKDWVLVAHACNPSYSGGSNQEDHSSKPALGK
jgi:hypothetical protein